MGFPGLSPSTGGSPVSWRRDTLPHPGCQRKERRTDPTGTQGRAGTPKPYISGTPRLGGWGRSKTERHSGGRDLTTEPPSEARGGVVGRLLKTEGSQHSLWSRRPDTGSDPWRRRSLGRSGLDTPSPGLPGPTPLGSPSAPWVALLSPRVTKEDSLPVGRLRPTCLGEGDSRGRETEGRNRERTWAGSFGDE